MAANPALGVVFHWLGGLASGSFYVPYRGVRRWSWETYWLVGGFFSWIIAPWFLAFVMTRSVAQVLHETPTNSLFWTYIFGALWGLGDRKSTRLNSSHGYISYAVFCLKKKKKKNATVTGVRRQKHLLGVRHAYRSDRLPCRLVATRLLFALSPLAPVTSIHVRSRNRA